MQSFEPPKPADRRTATEAGDHITAPSAAALIDQSPRSVQLRTMAQMLHDSPQTKRLDALATRMTPPGQPAAQLTALPEEELLQGRFATVQRQTGGHAQQMKAATPTNRTGLPDSLKSGIETLSGLSMDHVRVHYNSSQPAQLNAHAYAQGSDIHLAPGQEQHLPHEAWHVVQQAQGRVRPTMQMKSGVPVNDDARLEHEADVMGTRAANLSPIMPLQRRMEGNTRAIDQRNAMFTSFPQVHQTLVQRVTDISNVVMKVGLELTFANTYTAANLKEGGSISAGFKNQFDTMVEMLRTACEDAEEGPWSLEEVIRAAPAKQIFKGVDVDDAKFVFRDEIENTNWWFNLSLDPGVIEIQTKPVEGNNYDNDTWISDIVGRIIYGALQTNGIGGIALGAAVDTGGGHINIDLADSGISKPVDVINLIEIWSAASNRLTGDLELFERTHTAALLEDSRFSRSKDLGLEKEAHLQDIFHELKKIAQAPSLAIAKSRLIEFFFNFPQLGLVNENKGFLSESLRSNQASQIDHEKKIAIHNQALNIEHIDEGSESARFEFRNIRAQKNLRQIQESILYCVSAIEAVLAGDKTKTDLENEIKRI